MALLHCAGCPFLCRCAKKWAFACLAAIFASAPARAMQQCHPCLRKNCLELTNCCALRRKRAAGWAPFWGRTKRGRCACARRRCLPPETAAILRCLGLFSRFARMNRPPLQSMRYGLFTACAGRSSVILRARGSCTRLKAARKPISAKISARNNRISSPSFHRFVLRWTLLPCCYLRGAGGRFEN